MGVSAPFLRFLLKTVQHIEASFERDRVNRAVGIAVMILRQLSRPGGFALEQLGTFGRETLLRDIQRDTEFLAQGDGHRNQIPLAAADPDKRLFGERITKGHERLYLI